MTQPQLHPHIDAITAGVKCTLAPLASAIDQEGHYPEAFLRQLGTLGGFNSAIAVEHGGLGLDISRQLEVTARVGSECGSTAFLVWCQSTVAWYLQHAPNRAVRQRYLTRVAKGELLAGTGMSNPVKHLAGIERINLTAQRDGDHYVVNGILPWVSNIGEGHLIAVAAAVENEGFVMLAALGGTPGLELHPCPEFSGMEGTRTLNVRFKDLRVSADDVLAHPHQFPTFIQRIKPGFVLGQIGIGVGIIEGSLKTIRESNATHAHVNVYLDDQGSDLAEELRQLQDNVAALAPLAQDGTAPTLDVLRARAHASELTLKSANSAVLHAGARGYLMRHPAQRRLREAVFVAIVTPALKHLRKEIDELERQRAEAA